MNQFDILRQRIPRAKSPIGSFTVTDEHGANRTFAASAVEIGATPEEYNLSLSTSLDGFRALIARGNTSVELCHYEWPTSPPFAWQAQCSQPVMAREPIVRVTIKWPISAVQDDRIRE